MPPETVTGWVRQVDERRASTDADTNRRVAALRRRVLQALHAGGANIALGTDSPQVFSVPGFAVHHEMAFYVDIGMTPYAVLRDRHSQAGRVLRQGGRVRHRGGWSARRP